MTNRCPDSFKLGDESLLAFYFGSSTNSVGGSNLTPN